MSDTIEAKDWALLRDPVIRVERLAEIRQKLGFIIDMDNVIYKVIKETQQIDSVKKLNWVNILCRVLVYCLVLKNLFNFWMTITKSICS